MNKLISILSNLLLWVLSFITVIKIEASGGDFGNGYIGNLLFIPLKRFSGGDDENFFPIFFLLILYPLIILILIVLLRHLIGQLVILIYPKSKEYKIFLPRRLFLTCLSLLVALMAGLFTTFLIPPIYINTYREFGTIVIPIVVVVILFFIFIYRLLAKIYPDESRTRSEIVSEHE